MPYSRLVNPTYGNVQEILVSKQCIFDEITKQKDAMPRRMEGGREWGKGPSPDFPSNINSFMTEVTII